MYLYVCIYNIQAEIVYKFSISKDLAILKGQEVSFILLRAVLRNWRTEVNIFIKKKEISVIKIQSECRRFLSLRISKMKKIRVIKANRKSIFVQEIHYNFVRMIYLHNWHKKTEFKIRSRATEAIISSLESMQYYRQYKKAKNLILNVLKIRQIYYFKESLIRWKNKLQKRKIAVARLVLRRWIRSILLAEKGGIYVHMYGCLYLIYIS
jgi:hypothetical protein